jgi:hypothetical protein
MDQIFLHRYFQCCINNGHLSEFFFLEKVRQGDLLSPYLLILVLELRSAALKNDPQVSGVAINGFEYLLSQYADDSALILEDDQNSLEQALNIPYSTASLFVLD